MALLTTPEKLALQLSRARVRNAQDVVSDLQTAQAALTGAVADNTAVVSSILAAHGQPANFRIKIINLETGEVEFIP